jgi:hypothetical protein
MSTLFPADAMGVYFDATFHIYTVSALRYISSLKEVKFWFASPQGKSDILVAEYERKKTPQIETMMLIYGPMPNGAVSIPVHTIAKILEKDLAYSSDPTEGYALITSIVADTVIVRYSNKKFQFDKQAIIHRYTLVVTDFALVDATSHDIDEASTGVAAMRL